MLEVHELGLCLVARARQTPKGICERVVPLAPKRIGSRERHAAPSLNLLHPRGQGRKSRVGVLRWLAEMKRLCHFGFRLTPCAAVRHRQRRGDAVRRKEQVAGLGFELLIKLDSERGVAFHH